MEERSAAGRGFLLLSIAGILSKILSVFYIPFLRGIIGLDGYGIYQTCYEVFLFVYAVTNLGTQPAIAKIVSEFDALERPVDSENTLRVSKMLLSFAGGILSLLLMAFAFPIGRIINNPDASFGILLLAPSIFVTSLLSSYRGYFQGKNSMTHIAISQVIEQIVNIVVSLLCAYLLMKISVVYGSAGATVGTSIAALIAFLYMMIIYRRDRCIHKEKIHQVKKRARTKKIIKKLFKYGFPITLSAGLQNFGSLVDMVNVNARLLFAGFSSEKSHELYGILGSYKTLLSVPLIIITALSTTVLPALSAAMAVHDKKSIRKKVNFIFRLVFIITVPASFGLAVLSREIYILLFTIDVGYELMLIGSIILILMSVVQIQSVILQSINKLYYVLGTFCLGIIAKITANYFLVGIPSINVKGAVVGNFLWYIIPLVLNQIAIRKSLKVKSHLIKYFVKPLIASIVMVFVICIIRYPLSMLYVVFNCGVIVKDIGTLIMVSFGALAYLYVIILIKGLKKKDIYDVSPRIYRIMPRFLRKNLK
ncbi:polysaccharide biosynthesis protein [Clostridium sp. BJN0001]|uniref:putative polysaccharide biosynthesis protein n=1 Tax=Clostridium sp. BJN0001 TaxID=2930219 RepID=UPI001FD55D74|nr:polysaccharide biosynthesis protein [Clostridium sp. BJN0001]